jgi:hypothetical protein
MSYRKLGILIGQLPPESATATAMRNAVAESGGVGGEEMAPEVSPSEATWSQTEMLLASLIDEVKWLRYEFRVANSKQPGPAPSPMERPGVKGKKRRKRLTMDQAMKIDPRMRGERGD